jgi:site-specific recombinase XerC
VTHGTMGAAGGLVASLASEGKRIGDRDIQRRIGQIASNSQLAADALDAYRRKGVNFPSKLLQLMLPYSQKAISSP